jgi:hypothetical protein
MRYEDSKIRVTGSLTLADLELQDVRDLTLVVEAGITVFTEKRKRETDHTRLAEIGSCELAGSELLGNLRQVKGRLANMQRSVEMSSTLTGKSKTTPAEKID